MAADVLLNPRVDRVFEALRDRERRQLLIRLRDGRIDHEDDIVAGEGDRMRLQLRHTHLPKLMQLGYIEWQPETGEIAAGAHFDEVAPLLALIENHADELPREWP